MLELLLAEAHQRFDRDLIIEAMAARELEHLDVDVALDESEDVGVAAALHAARKPAFALSQEVECRYQRQAVRQELVVADQAALAQYIRDRPTCLLGGVDRALIGTCARGLDGRLHGSGLRGEWFDQALSQEPCPRPYTV